MIKIDGDKFDNAMEKALTTDDEYKGLISQVKDSMNTEDDSLINSLNVRIFEIAYQRGFKDGMTFIIKREGMELFHQN
jgi:hypothetical protein